MRVLADKPSKSLMRMHGPKGNPMVGKPSAIIGCLREREEVQLKDLVVCQPRDIVCLSPFLGTVAEHVLESVPQKIEQMTLAERRISW